MLANTTQLEEEYRALRENRGLPAKLLTAVRQIDIATVSGSASLIRSERTGRAVVRAMSDYLPPDLLLTPLDQLDAPVTYTNTLPPEDQIRRGWHDGGYGSMTLDGRPLMQPDYLSAHDETPYSDRRW